MRVLSVIAIGIILYVWQSAAGHAEGAAGYQVPLFRSIDQTVKAPSTEGIGSLRLLTDENFPPFSFRDASGSMKGIGVELALGVCSELSISCEIVAMPWSALRPALESGQGSAIISGMRMIAKSAEGLDATRPFFRSLGRFATRVQGGTTDVTPSALAGKKIGAVKGSGHAAWLARYFKKTEIIAFGTGEFAREALRAGQVDVIFGDALELIYWTRGKDSAGCCQLIDGAYVDTTYFSHPMFYVVRRGDTPLRRVLDFGLDRMQSTGRFAEIFQRYVPLNPW